MGKPATRFRKSLGARFPAEICSVGAVNLKYIQIKNPSFRQGLPEPSTMEGIPEADPYTLDRGNICSKMEAKNA